MKKILLISIFILISDLSAQANEIKRIFVGNESAKISIIAFESLTCSSSAGSGGSRASAFLKPSTKNSISAQLLFEPFCWSIRI